MALMDGLVTRGCGFKSRLRQEWSTTEVRPLSKAPNPRLLPGCPLLQVCVCALGWVKYREHILLLVTLCIIVYVTNTAHLSLIFKHVFHRLQKDIHRSLSLYRYFILGMGFSELQSNCDTRKHFEEHFTRC